MRSVDVSELSYGVLLEVPVECLFSSLLACPMEYSAVVHISGGALTCKAKCLAVMYIFTMQLFAKCFADCAVLCEAPCGLSWGALGVLCGVACGILVEGAWWHLE